MKLTDKDDDKMNVKSNPHGTFLP